MKLAMYKVTDTMSGYSLPLEFSENRENSSEYIRISEIVDIDFPMLPPAATVQRELDALATEEETARQKFNEFMDSLKFRRSKLLALTHEGDPE